MKVSDHDLKKCVPCAGGIYCPDLSIAFLKTENVKLRKSLRQAHEILEEYHRRHGVPRGDRATRLALLSSDVVEVKGSTDES